VHDHTPLYKAAQQGATVYPVYVFDPALFETSPIGLPRTGPFRVQFMLEALVNLKANLQKLGGDLIVKHGNPVQVLSQLAQQLNVEAVYTSKEVGTEEIAHEENLEDALLANGCLLKTYWHSTLLHVNDIPWNAQNLPDTFTQFRKEAERSTPVKETLPAPTSLPTLPESLDVGLVPELAYFDIDTSLLEQGSALVKGGENEGLDRLQKYVWEQDLLKVYRDTRNGLLGMDYSSKLSAWLALGCLSPRTVYETVKEYEAKRVKNKSTYWLIFELLWRDYFRFVARKYHKNLFLEEGIKGQRSWLKNDHAAFQKWCQGTTGIPFIDANMREIASTGFMSNRGRQNVASFLVKDLKVNWTWGAYYFEYLLLDYDVASNWGNWNYVAGVGNDPRENRYFNIISQAKRYDPHGDYVRYWLPELHTLKGSKIHHPSELMRGDLERAGINLGTHYPKPIVDFDRWMK